MSGKGLKHTQKNVGSKIFPERPLDIGELVDDSTKSRKISDWTASLPLEKGLRRTIDFWRSKLLKGCWF